MLPADTLNSSILLHLEGEIIIMNHVARLSLRRGAGGLSH